MVKDYGFKHISGKLPRAHLSFVLMQTPAGDLLREEQDRPGSKYGDLIRQYIKDGLIVPSEITIKVREARKLRSSCADLARAASLDDAIRLHTASRERNAGNARQPPFVPRRLQAGQRMEGRQGSLPYRWFPA